MRKRKANVVPMRQTQRENARLEENSASFFAAPSFFRGISRLFDLGGAMSSRLDGLTPEEIDVLALLADYRAVTADHQAAQIQMQRMGLWEDRVS